MKKAWLFAGALSALSISTGAAALDSAVPRALHVSGLALNLGTLTFIPLGSVHSTCNYLAAWASPNNPNDVQGCTVLEGKTSFTPSCIANSTADIRSFLLAGPAGCNGFDLLGQAVAGVQLYLAESPTGVTHLFGIGILHGAPYPISSQEILPRPSGGTPRPGLVGTETCPLPPPGAPLSGSRPVLEHALLNGLRVVSEAGE
jgi:hypothetical protein